MLKKIIVTGGGGYIGTNLVKKLISIGYVVTVIDTFWFGNYLKPNKNLKVIKKDIRNISKKDIGNADCIIHLASIANDPAAELDASLTWDVNVVATFKIINLAIKQKIKNLFMLPQVVFMELKMKKGYRRFKPRTNI